MDLLKKTGEKKIEYKYLGGESITSILKNVIPRELIPSNLTGKIMGYIFLIVVLISLVQFSQGSFLMGDLTKKINIGIPKPFLEFDLLNPSENPLNKKGLMIDLFSYLFLAYLIEVFLNLFKNTHFLTSKKEKEKIPKIFETGKEKTLQEKLTKKAFEKVGIKNILKKKEKNLNQDNTLENPSTNNFLKKSPTFDSKI